MESDEMDILNYYRQSGMMTDPGEYKSLFEPLPESVKELCEVIQGFHLHIFWAERYGIKLSEERQKEVNFRTIPQMLKRLLEMEPGPLGVARPLEKKLVGNCRDFTLLLTAMLQQKGVPARARCGFGTYFLPDHFEDHWVCEYWNASEKRWIMVDAQLDAFQAETLKIDFDPLDVPPDRFITGGNAWLMCRRGEQDPDKFGIFDMRGYWFILGDLVRDFLALNKIEILPWDPWGFILGPEEFEAGIDWQKIDQLADLTIGGDKTFAGVRSFYNNEPIIQIPEGWVPD